MRLWTWQKQGFDLTDQNVQVESLENSHFLNNIYISKTERDNFKHVYIKLFETLETDQFHWYFTEEDEAKSKESHLEFPPRGRVLWEIDVPVAEVFKRICDIAWNRLLNGNTFPSKLYDYWRLKANYDHSLIKKCEQKFHDFWESKSEDELWDLLFLEKCVDECTDILLCHPLDDSWIIRNPINEGKWWDIHRGNRYGPTSYTSSLPCSRCSGRKPLS